MAPNIFDRQALRVHLDNRGDTPSTSVVIFLITIRVEKMLSKEMSSSQNRKSKARIFLSLTILFLPNEDRVSPCLYPEYCY